MIALESRISAARRKALRSTRPRTQDDDESPRADHLILNLCASVIIPEDANIVQKRARDFYKTLRPQNHLHRWYVSQVSMISIRIDRDERIERRVRDKIAIKAEVFWESDRKLEAIRLGNQLGNQPEEVVELLQRTPRGCEWLPEAGPPAPIEANPDGRSNPSGEAGQRLPDCGTNPISRRPPRIRMTETVAARRLPSGTMVGIARGSTRATDRTRFTPGPAPGGPRGLDRVG